MTEDRLKELNALTELIWRLRDAITHWEQQEQPLNPGRFGGADLVDHDAWAIYRRRSIDALASRLAKAEAELKAA